jgi:hypothetical protein
MPKTKEPEIPIHKLSPQPFQDQALADWKPGNVCGQKGHGSSSWDHVNCKECKRLRRRDPAAKT